MSEGSGGRWENSVENVKIMDDSLFGVLLLLMLSFPLYVRSFSLSLYNLMAAFLCAAKYKKP